MALFDAFVMVDWSALRVAALERGRGELLTDHASPEAAVAFLADLLSDLSARGLTTLFGSSEPVGTDVSRRPREGGDPSSCHAMDSRLRGNDGRGGGNDGRGRGNDGPNKALQALRRHPWISDQLRLWLPGTGLDRPAPGSIVMTETTAQPRHLARLDDAGRLGTQPTTDYIRDPAAIYERSFAIIRAEADLARFPGVMEDVAVRVIHACGMPEIAEDLSFSEGAAEAGRAALRSGKPVLVDVQMVAHGIIRARLSAGNPVVCSLNDPRSAPLAQKLGTTRSAAAVELWREQLEGAVVAIGNAPTALFHLLEMVRNGGPRPAVILGFPVGFVGAAESKDALVGSGLPHIALLGRRGGSAMAAAAVNALAGEPA